MIIGLSGKFASGKDNIADHLVERWGFKKLSFAAKLKEVCTDLFSMAGKDRSLLQVVGAKMREVDDLVWVRYPFSHTDTNRDDVVVNDVRYQNEARHIHALGGILIRVVCLEEERIRRYEQTYGVSPTWEQVNHVSETDLDRFMEWDRTIYTTYSTKEETRSQVDEIMKRLDPTRQ
jgi:hypothetical protein